MTPEQVQTEEPTKDNEFASDGESDSEDSDYELLYADKTAIDIQTANLLKDFKEYLTDPSRSRVCQWFD